MKRITFSYPKDFCFCFSIVSMKINTLHLLLIEVGYQYDVSKAARLNFISLGGDGRGTWSCVQRKILEWQKER